MTDTQNTQNTQNEAAVEDKIIRTFVTTQLFDRLQALAGSGGKASEAAAEVLYKHFELPVPVRETPAEKRAREAREERERLLKVESENDALKKQIAELKASMAKPADKPVSKPVTSQTPASKQAPVKK